MGYYSYKGYRDLIPLTYQGGEKWLEANYGREYDGDANYDGDQWVAAAMYINDLVIERKKLIEVLKASRYYIDVAGCPLFDLESAVKDCADIEAEK